MKSTNRSGKERYDLAFIEDLLKVACLQVFFVVVLVGIKFI